MIKALLVDDEINALRMLELELSNAFPEIQIVDKLQNAREAIAVFENTKPDILIIDIEMPQMNGFEFVNSIQSDDCQVIFATAYSQYGIEAVKANALDYILKPIDTQELKDAVSKALRNIERKKLDSLQSIDLLIQKIESSQSAQIKIPTSNGFVFLKKEDIIYCQSESNYTHIHTTQKSYLVSKTLKYIQELLPEDSFARIHASFLVNINHIKEYSRKDGGFVILSNNLQLKVSESKKDFFS